MSGSLNKMCLIGNLGADPEVRSLGEGNGEVASLRIATSERWKDRTTGETKENTEWHSVSIFGDGLVNVAKNYLRKGSKVYIEGALRTRSYEKDGVTQYKTEIQVRGFGGVLTMLDGKSDNDNAGGGQRSQGGGRDQDDGRNMAPAGGGYDDGLDSDVPF